MNSLQSALCALVALSFAGSPILAADAITELLSEAQQAYLRGDVESAKAKFESVNKLDPKNQTAIGYLRNIKAKEAQTAGAGSQEKQLAKLVLPKVEFKDAALKAALDYLKQSVAKQSEGKQAVNFVIQLPEEQANAPVTLSLTNIPFTEVLKYLGTLAHVSFSYDRYAIMVRPAGSAAQAKAAPAPGQ